VKKRDAATFALKARREIAQELRALKILSVPRSSALLNYLTVLEAESVKAAVSSPGSTVTTFGAHRQAVESSTHAIPAIFGQCPQDRVLPIPTVLPEVFNLAYDLFTFTHNYDQVDYSFRLADRGQWEISVAQKEPRITFSYASPKEDQADTLARAREIQGRLSDERWGLDPEVVAEKLERLRVALTPQTRLAEAETCEYTIGTDVLGAMRDLANAFFQGMPIGMASDAKVGKLTFGDFRMFWSALLAVIQTHTMAHDLACGGDFRKFPIQTIVIKKKRNALAELLASVSRLSQETSGFILRCYTYEPTINGTGPICLPFFPLAEDYLCVSSLLATFYDFERNFFKLLHRSPLLLTLASEVDKEKEPIAIKYLLTLFPESEYAAKECVVIPGKTDADLVVYSRRTGFVLVIQHKWLTAPETADESSSNDGHLAKGVSQGVAARDYFRQHEEFLRQVLSLPVSAPVGRVECVTVCRGLEGSSFMEPRGVPVVMEQAFEALFKESGTLEKLWDALLARPDKVLAAQEAVDGRMSVRIGEYEFVIPALGF